MGKKSAFSLVELMVAVGIVGILVTIAFPRYQQFMVNSRRGEAKSNLSHLSSLQAAYKIDHFRYYYGEPMTGMNGIGYRDGRGRHGVHSCNPENDLDEGLCNHLGFQPEAVDKLRYHYRLADLGRRAVAGAASDARERWIYPDCKGGGDVECGEYSGDVVAMNVNGRPEVCRNISKFCPESGGGGSGVFTPPPLPPPPPPTCDTATQCCPDGPTGAPATSCTRGGGWTFSATAPTASDGCCECNRSCPSGQYLGSDCQCHSNPTPPPTCTQSSTVCCPDGPGGAGQTTCDKSDADNSWTFDSSQGDCCHCPIDANSCDKGEEWGDCKCNDCGTCPYLKVHTTRGSCDCDCEKTEQELCTDAGLTWGASCDCSSINPYYTWTKSGDCYYSCACNVATLAAHCAANGENTDPTNCECEVVATHCASSTTCCTGTREKVASDCPSGQVLRPHPDCCTPTGGMTLNILTVRSACILTDAQMLAGQTDTHGIYVEFRTHCYGAYVNKDILETITDASRLTAECGMNIAEKIAAVEGMYNCLKAITTDTTKTKKVRDEAKVRLTHIHADGNCDISGDLTELAREPNKCTLNIPPLP